MLLQALNMAARATDADLECQKAVGELHMGTGTSAAGHKARQRLDAASSDYRCLVKPALTQPVVTTRPRTRGRGQRRLAPSAHRH